MAKDKSIKTNAMRILDTMEIEYKVKTYACDEFTDGVTVANTLGVPAKMCFKTLVTQGKGGGYFVFVIPCDKELNLKACAKAVGEKAVEMIHVKDINKVTGYIRGGCTSVGMKKQYPTVVDSSALALEEVMVSAGKIGMQLILFPQDLLRANGGKVADIVM